MRKLLLTIALLACAMPQHASAADPDEIVVEGARDRDKQIQTFVDALTPTRLWGQLGRFDLEVCPRMVGLLEAENRQIESRMLDVAKAAGIKVAAPGCQINSLVLAVRNKDEFLAQLRKKHPRIFLDPVDGEALKKVDPGPTALWHITGMRDADGEQVPIVDIPGVGKYYMVTARNMGRTKPNARPEFLAAILVIERNALKGLTTTQVADYSAMRLFANASTRRLEKLPAASILTAVDAPPDTPVPITLTNWDLAFLKGLYATDPVQYASSQRYGIRKKVRRELDEKTK